MLEVGADPAAVERIHSRLEELAPDASRRVCVGRWFVELIRTARELEAGLIVVGATGQHTEGRLALGVTVDRLARKADRPVLVVRRPARGKYRSVLAGVDGSPDAAQAVRLARRIAPRAHLTAVLADPGVGEEWLRACRLEEADFAAYGERLLQDAWQRLARAAEHLPVDELEAVVGRPDAQLLQMAERLESELVAVGRRGVSQLAPVLLGSVGHHLVHEASCDVLVYRSHDVHFEPP